MREEREKAEDKDDEDKLILLSLVSSFKNIPQEFKLDAKAEFIGLLKKYNNLSTARSSSVLQSFPTAYLNQNLSDRNIFYTQPNHSSLSLSQYNTPTTFSASTNNIINYNSPTPLSQNSYVSPPSNNSENSEMSIIDLFS